jgi:hypothetical protein
MSTRRSSVRPHEPAPMRADAAAPPAPAPPTDAEEASLLVLPPASAPPLAGSATLLQPSPTAAPLPPLPPPSPLPLSQQQQQQPPAPPPPPPPPAWYKYAAFFALVTIQVSLALSFKAAQDAQGRYPFSPPAMLILSEFCKLLLSLGGLLGLTSAAACAAEAAERGGDPASLAVRARATLAQFRREALGSAQGRLPAYACGLALLYCVNNNITFVIFQWADGGNINLIKAGSTFVSALVLLGLLGRRISGVQWAAVLIQSAGLVITQFGANCSAANTPVLAPAVYAALLCSLTITAFSSVCNEKVLKDVGREGVSLNTVNALMYGAGAALNLGVHLLSGGGLGATFFAGMGQPASLAVLLCNSVIGIAVVAVYKYADAVVKSFASACSTAVLFLIGALFFGVSVNVVVAAGCVCIFTATHLYSSNPPAPAEGSGGGGGGGAAGAAGAAQPAAAEAKGPASGSEAGAAVEGAGSSSSSSSGSSSAGSGSLLPQTRRDYLLLSLCAFLLLVVMLEPYFLAQRGGGGGGGVRRLLGAATAAVGCGGSAAPSFLASDAVAACFL